MGDLRGWHGRSLLRTVPAAFPPPPWPARCRPLRALCPLRSPRSPVPLWCLRRCRPWRVAVGSRSWRGLGGARCETGGRVHGPARLGASDHGRGSCQNATREALWSQTWSVPRGNGGSALSRNGVAEACPGRAVVRVRLSLSAGRPVEQLGFQQGQPDRGHQRRRLWQVRARARERLPRVSRWAERGRFHTAPRAERTRAAPLPRHGSPACPEEEESRAR